MGASSDSIRSRVIDLIHEGASSPTQPYPIAQVIGDHNQVSITIGCAPGRADSLADCVRDYAHQRLRLGMPELLAMARKVAHRAVCAIDELTTPELLRLRDHLLSLRRPALAD